MTPDDLDRGRAIAARVEAFVRDAVIPYEQDPRGGAHGPSEELVVEMRDKARAAGLITPHIGADGSHLSHRSFSFRVLEKVGIRECKVFRSKYYPQGWRFLPKTGGLTLLSRPIPELPLRPERK